MTRTEYRKQALLIHGGYFVDSVLSPTLLRESAVALFMNGDFESEFAIETKRRLKQLEVTGYTDAEE
jgi:hypothetical protein